MHIIGITGGVGAGKTTVLTLLQELVSCKVILADDVAKTTLLPGEEGYCKVVEALGKAILNEDGTIHRGKMAAVIFKDETKRTLVNAIIHPLTKTKIRDMVTEYRNKKELEFIFIEAALLIEDHYEELCEEFWYIFVPEAVRTERLMENRGYSEEKCRDIMNNQLSEAEFRAHTAFVIDNSKDYESTKKQLEKKLEEYKK